ncbi:MAG: trypsin-like peptidase domain-containing protein, partial [Clostridiales bacterium]|nr:trypsin-like peptidase domain-containing protein [Clostridiales bacterium]
LRADDSTLIEKFIALQSRKEVADLLEIDVKTLIYFLYRRKDKDNYKIFYLRKRSGKERTICAPINSLKIIQRKLNYILSLIYKPKPSAHGFIVERSILTNAQAHLKNNNMLNVDILDFFPNINFGRVRGMFMANPYNIPPEPATVLAQICSCNNQLPQGAPTSPIISNMICAQLDSQLQKLAKKHSCTYTRYGDDLSFSTWQYKFPKELGYKTKTGEVIVGISLEKIIRQNGFKHNKDKVTLKSRKSRLSVTGLIVNEIPNVPRKFVRQIRAMLHSWEKDGLIKAEQIHLNKYRYKQKNPKAFQPKFSNIVRGKINYIRMIKGEENPVYQKLASKFNDLNGGGFPKYYHNLREELEAAVWIIEGEGGTNQGTGFMLEGFGMITCAHVLTKSMEAFRCNDYGNKFPVEIISYDNENDVAVLKIKGNENYHYLRVGDSDEIDVGSEIKLSGFPNYNIGDSIYIDDGKVTLCRKSLGRTRYLISARIVKGNSGGPVLNKNNEVIGIAAKGAPCFEDKNMDEKFEVIPITIINPEPL